MATTGNLQEQKDSVYGWLPGTSQPVNWCGCPMRCVGVGQYPYDCESKRRRPNAKIYRSDCEHSTSAWVAVGH